ncbi:hypothetical protein E0D86_10000 [Pseudomonas sp. IC_126]|uniref:AAA family ATPase n=1 Tax=Pseudomonas sp. IC_126 TaxID=2547400 RepID=UPI00103F8659|nr:AAA family ATPase [Pseudomonas sp. IC_126]TCD22952.1 hypothetical protein E0D86_10000 [Pseudomonas sp. IC_126]
MTIVCIEGASSVGKTTVCRILEAEFGFTRVPEVNELYARSSEESPSWYFERQVDRWEMANEVSSSGGSAILDGDPFQPVWYNWIFSDLGLQSIDAVLSFYCEKLNAGTIRLPDKYYLLTAGEIELRRRKESDPSRSRSNFEMHLRLIEPQLAYFAAMNEGAPGLVSIMESIDSKNLAKLIATESSVLKGKSCANIFDVLCGFVSAEHNKKNQADA